MIEWWKLLMKKKQKKKKKKQDNVTCSVFTKAITFSQAKVEAKYKKRASLLNIFQFLNHKFAIMFA